jgi:hypothetical protein
MKKLLLSALARAAVIPAAKQYIARRDRTEHPEGTFDKAGRWYPTVSEKLNTSAFRSPSREWPYSYMLACRSLAHVAALHGLSSPDELLAVRRAVRQLDAAASAAAPALVASA